VLPSCPPTPDSISIPHAPLTLPRGDTMHHESIHVYVCRGCRCAAQQLRLVFFKGSIFEALFSRLILSIICVCMCVCIYIHIYWIRDFILSGETTHLSFISCMNWVCKSTAYVSMHTRHIHTHVQIIAYIRTYSIQIICICLNISALHACTSSLPSLPTHPSMHVCINLHFFSWRELCMCVYICVCVYIYTYILNITKFVK
jgi:hypothetical protein